MECGRSLIQIWLFLVVIPQSRQLCEAANSHNMESAIQVRNSTDSFFLARPPTSFRQNTTLLLHLASLTKPANLFSNHSLMVPAPSTTAFLTMSSAPRQALLAAETNVSCSTSHSAREEGICVDYDNVNSLCWDQDIRESSDCDQDRQVCCVERISKAFLDDGPCGTTGSSIRSPRRLRPVTDAITKDVCWMAFISIVRSQGEREYICDAVIFNSTHILTPSECAIKLRKEAAIMTKKLLVTIGKPVSQFRQSLDFSQQRCGQEFALNQTELMLDTFLVTLVRKGYALFRLKGRIQQDQCTCRVCLPTKDDVTSLTIASTCFVAGFLSNAGNGKMKKASGSLDLLVYRTNLISAGMCQSLLTPQNLPADQVKTIISKLLCSVTPNISGYCVGGMGGSLTCVGDYDQRHYLIGLSVQPIDCYSAPRLFRNTAGCYDTIADSTSSCLLPDIFLSRENQCGRPKTNISQDLFGLGFQTVNGTANRALNIGRRMQMLSPFPVSDAALLGRSGFSGSEISQPGLHLLHDDMDVCWAVAVFNPVKGHCSGVLITSRHVLTAAHCVTEHDGSPVQDTYLLSVFVGFDSIPRDVQRDCEVIYRIKSIRVHPLYSKPSGTRFYDLNDVALVELDGSVDLDNNACACTICLDNLKDPLPGELCTLSGYGCPAPILATESCPAPRPWSLSWANVVVLSEDICSAIPHYPSQAMICTVTDGGPSGCYGDSGGPLVCFDESSQRHYLSGIFSFILSTTGSSPQKCRIQPLNPNFYTKVTNYMPWLIENVAGLEITL